MPHILSHYNLGNDVRNTEIKESPGQCAFRRPVGPIFRHQYLKDKPRELEKDHQCHRLFKHACCYLNRLLEPGCYCVKVSHVFGQ